VPPKNAHDTDVHCCAGGVENANWDSHGWRGSERGCRKRGLGRDRHQGNLCLRPGAATSSWGGVRKVGHLCSSGTQASHQQNAPVVRHKGLPGLSFPLQSPKQSGVTSADDQSNMSQRYLCFCMWCCRTYESVGYGQKVKMLLKEPTRSVNPCQKTIVYGSSDNGGGTQAFEMCD
jgi:hypothetical protein